MRKGRRIQVRQKINRLCLMVADAAVFAVSPFIALYLRVDDIAGSVYLDKIIHYLPVLLAVHFLAFFALQLYRRVWKYAGIHEYVGLDS